MTQMTKQLKYDRVKHTEESRYKLSAIDRLSSQ